MCCQNFTSPTSPGGQFLKNSPSRGGEILDNKNEITNSHIEINFWEIFILIYNTN